MRHFALPIARIAVVLYSARKTHRTPPEIPDSGTSGRMIEHDIGSQKLVLL